MLICGKLFTVVPSYFQGNVWECVSGKVGQYSYLNITVPIFGPGLKINTNLTENLFKSLTHLCVYLQHFFLNFNVKLGLGTLMVINFTSIKLSIRVKTRRQKFLIRNWMAFWNKLRLRTSSIIFQNGFIGRQQMKKKNLPKFFFFFLCQLRKWIKMSAMTA